MAILIAFVIFAILIALMATLGIAWVVAIPIVLIVPVLIWFGVAVGKGNAPSTMIRRSRRAELLGPGGPDDPDAQ
jgi:hypothetical protein